MAWVVAVAGWSNLDVVEQMTKKYFDCYFPKFRERIVRQGRKVWVKRFLFGRYFFVPQSFWVVAFSMPCVSSVLMNPDCRPALVGDDAIADLQRREIRGFLPIERKIRRGDRVVVTEGAMCGLTGQVEVEGPIVTISSYGIRIRVNEDSVRPG